MYFQIGVFLLTFLAVNIYFGSFMFSGFYVDYISSQHVMWWCRSDCLNPVDSIWFSVSRNFGCYKIIQKEITKWQSKKCYHKHKAYYPCSNAPQSESTQKKHWILTHREQILKFVTAHFFRSGDSSLKIPNSSIKKNKTPCHQYNHSQFPAYIIWQDVGD